MHRLDEAFDENTYDAPLSHGHQVDDTRNNGEEVGDSIHFGKINGLVNPTSLYEIR